MFNQHKQVLMLRQGVILLATHLSGTPLLPIPRRSFYNCNYRTHTHCGRPLAMESTADWDKALEEQRRRVEREKKADGVDGGW